jgi:hypothetical protein
LQSDGWLDLSTQQVNVEAAFLNAEAHIYTYMDVELLMHREGYVSKDVKVKPLRGNVYTHWSHIFLDICWGFVMSLLFYEAVERFQKQTQAGLLKFHLKDPYTWLDWLSIIFGLGIGLYFWGLTKSLDTFSEYISGLSEMPEFAVLEAPENRKVQATLDNKEYQDKLNEIFRLFSWLARTQTYHRLCVFWYSLVVVLRFFRGFLGQPRIAVLIQTIMSSVDFFLHYIVIFGVVFFSFAHSGYILFGEQREDWSTAGQSINGLFLILFGQFNTQFHGDVAITSASWFWLFYFSVQLLLINLLTAAMVHRYLDVRNRLCEPGVGIVKQTMNAVSEFWWKRTYEGSQKSVPAAELLEMLSADTDPIYLEKCGRLQVDRRLRTREDLHKAENDPTVDLDFLLERGCDPYVGMKLLEACATWRYNMSNTSSPSVLLKLLIAKQMSKQKAQVDWLESRLHGRVDAAAKTVDRLDLKHAKCAALARRIRKSQVLPNGWTAHIDKDGRRYLRQEETGLTSWTLPRQLI